MTDLWKLTGRSPAHPPSPHPQRAKGTHTVMESKSAAERGIDILVCGRRLTVPADRPLRLGREEGIETEDVFRAVMNVSRRHAELRYDGRRLSVTDTASSNGTFVDDQQLPPLVEYELRPGQSLRLASNVPIEIQWRR
ncbi:FHA domain-containing protein (plasmid) [Mycolicibacterium aichiense]|uniref:FHA domain-containing protein n=1 Tax=Mycolicibacterium aichiense TaxID=1799 RepID=UPI003D676E02